MIKFEKIDNEKRKFKIINEIDIDGKIEKTVITNLDLVFSPVSNKFTKLIDFLENCSKTLGPDFDNWFITLVNEYKRSDFNYAIIKNNVSELKRWCDLYLDSLNINFENYINKSKVSKNSIFFNAEELKKIIRVSNYLKIYFILAQDIDMRLINKFHKETYNELIDIINKDNNIIYKLFKVVSSKTYEYHFTDHYMWEYIKTIYCKTTDMHVFSIFNFLMNNILVTCNPESNPIPYLISVIDESIKWILKNIYKEAIIYSDSINTQDVYTIQGKDNLLSYSHNDSIGKLLIISYNLLEDIGIDNIETFKTTLNKLKEISLFSSYITYPILSKVLDIPYRHFLTLSVSNSYLLNLLVYQMLPKEFKTKYPYLSKMLLYYNKQKPILKTTYKIKHIDEFTKSIGTFLTFKNINTPYDLFSSIIGRIARNSYASFINDQEILNFPLAKLEVDMVKFYNEYFDEEERTKEFFDELRTKIDKML